MSHEKSGSRPRRTNFLTRLSLSAAVAFGAGAAAGALVDRGLNQPDYVPPYEALITPSSEDIRKLEALVAQGEFTELKPSDMIDGEGVVFQPVRELGRREMDNLLDMLADYSIHTGIPGLQHQVTESQLGDRSDYLFMGVNHLALPYSDGGSFNILTTEIRVFAASSGGPAEFSLTNPIPQSIDLYPGYHLGVRVDAAQDGRPNPGIRPIVVVLPASK